MTRCAANRDDPDDRLAGLVDRHAAWRMRRAGCMHKSPEPKRRHRSYTCASTPSLFACPSLHHRRLLLHGPHPHGFRRLFAHLLSLLLLLLMSSRECVDDDCVGVGACAGAGGATLSLPGAVAPHSPPRPSSSPAHRSRGSVRRDCPHAQLDDPLAQPHRRIAAAHGCCFDCDSLDCHCDCERNCASYHAHHRVNSTKPSSVHVFYDLH